MDNTIVLLTIIAFITLGGATIGGDIERNVIERDCRDFGEITLNDKVFICKPKRSDN